MQNKYMILKSEEDGKVLTFNSRIESVFSERRYVSLKQKQTKQEEKLANFVKICFTNPRQVTEDNLKEFLVTLLYENPYLKNPKRPKPTLRFEELRENVNGDFDDSINRIRINISVIRKVVEDLHERQYRSFFGVIDTLGHEYTHFLQHVDSDNYAYEESEILNHNYFGVDAESEEFAKVFFAISKMANKPYSPNKVNDGMYFSYPHEQEARAGGLIFVRCFLQNMGEYFSAQPELSEQILKVSDECSGKVVSSEDFIQSWDVHRAERSLRNEIYPYFKIDEFVKLNQALNYIDLNDKSDFEDALSQFPSSFMALTQSEKFKKIQTLKSQIENLETEIENLRKNVTKRNKDEIAFHSSLIRDYQEYIDTNIENIRYYNKNIRRYSREIKKNEDLLAGKTSKSDEKWYDKAEKEYRSEYQILEKNNQEFDDKIAVCQARKDKVKSHKIKFLYRTTLRILEKELEETNEQKKENQARMKEIDSRLEEIAKYREEDKQRYKVNIEDYKQYTEEEKTYIDEQTKNIEDYGKTIKEYRLIVKTAQQENEADEKAIKEKQKEIKQAILEIKHIEREVKENTQNREDDFNKFCDTIEELHELHEVMLYFFSAVDDENKTSNKLLTGLLQAGDGMSACKVMEFIKLVQERNFADVAKEVDFVSLMSSSDVSIGSFMGGICQLLPEEDAQKLSKALIEQGKFDYLGFLPNKQVVSKVTIPVLMQKISSYIKQIDDKDANIIQRDYATLKLIARDSGNKNLQMLCNELELRKYQFKELVGTLPQDKEKKDYYKVYGKKAGDFYYQRFLKQNDTKNYSKSVETLRDYM